MRVTQSMIARNIIQNITRTRENLHDIQTTLSTGKEIRNPSHDPLGYSRATRFKQSIARNEQYTRNIDGAYGWVETTSDALENIDRRLNEAREIAIQGVDDTNSAANREALAQRVDSIIEDTLSFMNSQYMGKYIFAGTATQGEEPFSIEGDALTYGGNTGRILRRLTDNLSVSININGQQLGDTGVIDSLITLRDALAENDSAGIQEAIAATATAGDNVTVLTTSIGSIRYQLDLTRQQLETANVNLSSYLSKTEDVDMAEAITKYNSEEIAYRAALQSASEIIQLNLLDYLK